MAIFTILKYPHPLLRKKCHPVDKVSPEIIRLIADMKETMLAVNGVGLAANQIGHIWQIIVAKLDDTVTAVINPKIIKRKGKIYSEEGCLSFPGLILKLKRARSLKVSGLDEQGNEIEIEAEETPARILQHEIDHLNGKVFIDHLNLLAKWRIKKQLRKKIKYPLY